MQRRGVASLQISTVHVLGGEQPLYTSQISFFRGVQKRRVAAQQVSHILIAFFDQVEGRSVVSILLGRISAVLPVQKAPS